MAVNKSDFSNGYLCQATADVNLTPLASVFLKDPNTGNGAELSDDGTASPTVGPDGDVYFGVLEQNIPSHHDRGWLLHFNSTLSTSKIPGSFGWDDSASIVPASLVPSYTGTSSYLVLTKYNDYSDPGIGGTGQNKVAILDPNATEPDPITPNILVMQEVISVVGADQEHRSGRGPGVVHQFGRDRFGQPVRGDQQRGWPRLSLVVRHEHAVTPA